MYKLAKGVSPTIMEEIFWFRNSSRYNLRGQDIFEIPLRNSVYNGKESISYLSPYVWELVPDKLEIINSLNGLKEQIKKLSENCHVDYVKHTFNMLVL